MCVNTQDHLCMCERQRGRVCKVHVRACVCVCVCVCVPEFGIAEEKMLIRIV